MWLLTVRGRFESAHRLRHYKGKCKNIHGHSYKVEVIVSGKKLINGMVMDFGDIKEELRKTINKFDHKLLNQLPEFRRKNPTAENIAKVVFDRLKDKFNVYAVRVWETEDNTAEYREAE